MKVEWALLLSSRVYALCLALERRGSNTILTHRILGHLVDQTGLFVKEKEELHHRKTALEHEVKYNSFYKLTLENYTCAYNLTMNKRQAIILLFKIVTSAL